MEGFDSGWDAMALATIQYPLKFELAARFMATHPSLSTSLSIEDQLMFYGLHQVGAVLRCRVPRHPREAHVARATLRGSARDHAHGI